MYVTMYRIDSRIMIIFILEEPVKTGERERGNGEKNAYGSTRDFRPCKLVLHSLLLRNLLSFDVKLLIAILAIY